MQHFSTKAMFSTLTHKQLIFQNVFDPKDSWIKEQGMGGRVGTLSKDWSWAKQPSSGALPIALGGKGHVDLAWNLKPPLSGWCWLEPLGCQGMQAVPNRFDILEPKGAPTVLKPTYHPRQRTPPLCWDSSPVGARLGDRQPIQKTSKDSEMQIYTLRIFWSSQVLNLWISKPIRAISNSHRLGETINTFKNNFVLVQWPWSIYDSDPSLACLCLSHICILNACGYGAVAAHWLTINIELLWILKVTEVSQLLEFFKFSKSQCSWNS